MTNDEAVQWCIDNQAKVHFLSDCVQVYVRLVTPTPTPLPYNAVQCKVTFLEAVEGMKSAFEAVQTGSLLPDDPSLIQPTLVAQPSPEPSPE